MSETGTEAQGAAAAAAAAAAGASSDAGQALPPDAMVTVKVDGVEVQKPLADVIRDAEKASGADKRFREAAEIKKQAADGIRLQELVRGMNAGGLTAEQTAENLMEYHTLLGYTDEQARAQVAQFQQLAAGQNGAVDGDGAAAGEETSEQLKQRLAQVEQSVQDDRNKVKNEETKAFIEAECRKAVDNDPLLGAMMKDKAANPELKNNVWDAVWNGVRRRVVADRRQYGPEIVQEAMAEVGFFLSRTPRNPVAGSEPGGRGDEAVAYPSLGTGGAAAAAQLQAGAKTERVPFGHPDYDANFQKRAEAVLRQAEASVQPSPWG